MKAYYDAIMKYLDHRVNNPKSIGEVKVFLEVREEVKKIIAEEHEKMVKDAKLQKR